MNGNRDRDLAGVPVRHERICGAGIHLHAAIAGDGPPVILLHGLPETWWSWRRQIPALARAGFSAWALDMRGYGVSLLDGLGRVAPRVRIARLPRASHWVQNDEPDEVNAMLVRFLSESSSYAAAQDSAPLARLIRS